MDLITNEIKKEIAEYFISDSKQFLFRYEKLREFQNDLSQRSKLMIDLMFSIECSLKALIFLESEDNEKITYKKIKTHDLKKLYGLIVDKSELIEFEMFLETNTDLYNVSSRYTLEAHINFRENNVLGELYYNTIADFTWLDSLYEVARSALDSVEKKQGFEMTIVNFSDIDIEKEIEKSERIKNISR